MRRNAPVPNGAVHGFTAWRWAAIGIVSVTCLLSLSSVANADVGRPASGYHGVAQPISTAPPVDSDDSHVSFRVVTEGEVVPIPPPAPPAPPAAPPPQSPTMASTGLNLPVYELIGLSLALLALGFFFVAIVSIKRGSTGRNSGKA